MAVIVILVCGCLGFTSALAALVLFDATLLQALGLWMGAGLAATAMILLPALLPRRRSADLRAPEIA